MQQRKQLIEEIMASIHAFKYRMSGSAALQGVKKRIPHSQWFVLCIIETHKNVGVKEIAKMLGITSSATTQLVDGLVKSGYVARKTNVQDKRSLQLVLSKKGQKHIRQMKRKYIAAMGKLFKALNDKELATYNKLHKKILTAIHK